VGSDIRIEKEKEMKLKKRLFVALLTLLSGGSALAEGGRVESIDLLGKIQPGITTSQQVRELLGPPARTMHFPARGLDALEYEARDFSERLIISISIGSDGVVREVMRLRQSGA
jgi:hypothetical protein